jgi:hypothetical protein
VKVTFTSQIAPSVTVPTQVLPLARVKSRLGEPWVKTLGVPRVPLAGTVKLTASVLLHGAGVVAPEGQTFTLPKLMAWALAAGALHPTPTARRRAAGATRKRLSPLHKKLKAGQKIAGR